MNSEKVLALNYSHAYALVMIVNFAMVGTFSFRYLDSNMQINQHLMPVSVFERYLIAIFDFFAILAVGTACYLFSIVLVQRIMELKYAGIVTKMDISMINYIRLVLADKFSVLLHLIIFTIAYFLSITIRLSLRKSNPIKISAIIAGIVFTLVFITFIFDLIISKIWGTIMADIIVFNNISLIKAWIFALMLLMLFSSVFLSYYLLKRRPHS